jgi:hypothetical protein
LHSISREQKRKKTLTKFFNGKSTVRIFLDLTKKKNGQSQHTKHWKQSSNRNRNSSNDMPSEGKETTAQGNEPVFEEVLEKLSTDLLRELLEGNGVRKADAGGAKKKQCSTIMEKAEELGSAIFIARVTADKEAMKEALMALEGKELDHDSKSKMTKDFKDHFKKAQSPEKFFEKFDVNVLDKFCKALEFQEEGGKDDKIDALCEELTIAGLRKMFETMAKEYVEEVANSLKLSKAGSKKKVIDRILAEGYPHLKEKVEEKAGKARKTKEELRAEAPDIKKIQKGITQTDLYQYYTEQLKQWLKEKGRLTGGSKKDMVKRILAYLAGDEEGTKALTPSERAAKGKRKRRKTSGGGSKKKKTKKEAESGEPAKKKAKTTAK